MTNINSATNTVRQYNGFLNNPKVVDFAKGAAGTVVGTTILKAVGRPAFIYGDKSAEPEAKKYSAAKEFLYQALCLVIALALIPLNERVGYKLAKRIKGNTADFLTNFEEKSKSLNKSAFKHFKEEYRSLEKAHKEISPEMKLVKGSMEFCSLVGSVIGLTIVAPLISHKILHPVMNAIGLEKKPGTPEPEVDLGDQELKTKNVDIKG